MKLKRLDHFGIEVRDLARAAGFYSSVLGLKVVARLGAEQILMKCGEQNLALFQVARPELTKSEREQIIANPLGKGHHAFLVSPGDFSTAAERLREAGVEVSKLIDWGDHDCIYFLDPDGNLLEVVSYR
jgi:catechol 2,3-dioxygenase-like lactoylglutathione lyase family enzyme